MAGIYSLGSIMMKLVCVFCGLMLTYCEPSPPKRPSTVPASAVWAGGADGGDWIDCRAGRDSNPCTVYNDQTGEVELAGEFILEDTRQPVPLGDLQYAGGTDGERIYLKDGRRLVQNRTP